MTPRALLEFLPLIVLLGTAAAIDARHRRIPNWLSFGLMAAGLGRAAMHGVLAHSVLGILAGAAIPLVMFAIGALGGGDVKLLGAIGAWVGPGPALVVFAIEAVLGLFIVLIQAAVAGRTRILFRNSAIIAANFAMVPQIGLEHAVETGKSCRSVNRPLPYAVPVFVATLIVLAMGLVSGN